MKPLIKAVIVLGLFVFLFFANKALAGSMLMVGIPLSPPPPRREGTLFRTRRGLTWMKGHWEWQSQIHRYEWICGGWVPADPGYELLKCIPDEPTMEST